MSEAPEGLVLRASRHWMVSCLPHEALPFADSDKASVFRCSSLLRPESCQSASSCKISSGATDSSLPIVTRTGTLLRIEKRTTTGLDHFSICYSASNPSAAGGLPYRGQFFKFPLAP